MEDVTAGASAQTGRSRLFQDAPEDMATESDRAGLVRVTRQVLPRRIPTSLLSAEPGRPERRVDLETLQRVRAGLDRL